MSTVLTKPVRRLTTIGARNYIVSLEPASDVERFPSLSFRQRGKRRRLTVPLESVLNFAGERFARWVVSERKRLRKLRKAGAM